MCILFCGRIVFPAAKHRERDAEKMFRVLMKSKLFLCVEADEMEKKRENERTNERHVSGQEMRIFGGRVCFKKAETDVLGRSE